MRMIFWAVILFGGAYSFLHAYFLFKDKNKIGAFGISLVGSVILILTFLVRLK
ncbi:hypothetical protein QNH48_12980 [Neobacillus sp. YX16]|uniref:hypothetical protein n=1 Tax=Neobacillus sp. YX16 TaxID=3047874 RepID=UPI0024C2C920|nr:hypothetical protein [Neobacillus sp. YX16]WHZ05481.1 hypothetical protein QNH48_12980 [Neobacillus sp. YX16]